MSAGGMRFVIPPFSVLVPGSRAHGERLSTSWPSWRRKAHDLDVKSRVHPHYKTKYHVGNLPAHDRALVQRGDVTLWLAPEAITTWTVAGVGKRGGQLQYSPAPHDFFGQPSARRRMSYVQGKTARG